MNKHYESCPGTCPKCEDIDSIRIIESDSENNYILWQCINCGYEYTTGEIKEKKNG